MYGNLLKVIYASAAQRKFIIKNKPQTKIAMKYSVIAIIASSVAATSMQSMSAADSTSMLWATDEPNVTDEPIVTDEHKKDYDQRGFSTRLCMFRDTFKGSECLKRTCLRGDIRWLMQGMETVHENAEKFTLDEMRNGEDKD